MKDRILIKPASRLRLDDTIMSVRTGIEAVLVLNLRVQLSVVSIKKPLLRKGGRGCGASECLGLIYRISNLSVDPLNVLCRPHIPVCMDSLVSFFPSSTNNISEHETNGQRRGS